MMNSTKEMRIINTKLIAVIGSIADNHPDLLADLESFRDIGGLNSRTANTILEEAKKGNNANAIFYLLKTIDGEFKLESAFEDYFRITKLLLLNPNKEQYVELYKCALKTCNAKYVRILHDKLGYSNELREDQIKICVQVAQQKFENFLNLLSKGEKLSGQECSWGYRAQTKMDLESWKKLQKFHDVLDCHPAVLDNPQVFELLKRDKELAKLSIRRLAIEKMQEACFLNESSAITSSEELRKLSSSSLSGQDPASSTSDGLEGSQIEITEELLRSRMDYLGKPVNKGHYSQK